MIIGHPRCGTAWAANWLTTDTTHCIHDPMAKFHHSDLDGLESSKRLGVACTGLGMFPDWLNAHPAKKVILHRDAQEVAQSLDRIGFSMLPFPDLSRIEGMHVAWTDLWNKPWGIWHHLIGTPFDSGRHEMLKELNVQIDVDRVKVDRTIAHRYLEKFV
jgi:hypothetical protein